MPNNYSLLQRNVSLNSTKRLHPMNCAVGYREGEIALHFDRRDSFTTAASVLKNSGREAELSVKAVTIAQIMLRLTRAGLIFETRL